MTEMEVVMMGGDHDPTSLDWWMVQHSDAFHPGSRDDCDHCQEMIRLFGWMPPVEDILRRSQELAREWRASRYSKRPIPEALRWEVFERDDFRCRMCGARRWLRADHIIPESKGGEMTLDNLQTLCRSCNSKKGGRG
jgi:5-methylcytosine-specific restriction endonuclease McrA